MKMKSALAASLSLLMLCGCSAKVEKTCSTEDSGMKVEMIMEAPKEDAAMNKMTIKAYIPVTLLSLLGVDVSDEEKILDTVKQMFADEELPEDALSFEIADNNVIVTGTEEDPTIYGKTKIEDVVKVLETSGFTCE